MSTPQDDFYGGTSAPGFSYTNPNWLGKARGGKIVAVRKRGAMTYVDPASRQAGKRPEPKMWGTPPSQIQQLVITVESAERDPANPADNGQRAHYIEQEVIKPDRQDSQYHAHCKAMEAAGKAGTLPEVGGEYFMAQTGQVQGRGPQPRKTWAAKYTPPVETFAQQPTQTSGNGQAAPTYSPTVEPSWDGGQKASQDHAALKADLLVQIQQAPDGDALTRLWKGWTETYGVGMWTTDLQAAAAARATSGFAPPAPPADAAPSWLPEEFHSPAQPVAAAPVPVSTNPFA